MKKLNSRDDLSVGMTLKYVVIDISMQTQEVVTSSKYTVLNYVSGKSVGHIVPCSGCDLVIGSNSTHSQNIFELGGLTSVLDTFQFCLNTLKGHKLFYYCLPENEKEIYEIVNNQIFCHLSLFIQNLENKINQALKLKTNIVKDMLPRLTLSNYIDQQVYLKNVGHTKLKLTLDKKDITNLVDLIGKGCSLKTRQRIYNNLQNVESLENFNIYKNLSIDKLGNWMLTAAQSYPDDLRMVRQLLRK